MRTQLINNARFAHRHASASSTAKNSGYITELRCSEQPGMMQMLLLPLLQQLSQQSRWQLWLTPAHKLDRSWLKESGLPLEKSMQVVDSTRCSSIESMVKALRTGNFSVVLAWLPDELNEEEREELELAAAAGGSLGLILYPGKRALDRLRPLKGIKIPSDLFH